MTGVVMYQDGYLDQPYCVINEHKSPMEWTCIITAQSGHEGGNGEHLVALISNDAGASWDGPYRLEPNNTVDNSYGAIVITPSGRIYATYVVGCARVSWSNSLPH